MARNLDVYLNRDKVGTLSQDDQGDLGFQYEETWLKNPKAVPLSQSLPLQNDSFDRVASRPFFGGILPEADQRDAIAANLGISKKNDFAMLEQIGGECAGAVTFLPFGDPLPEHDHSYLKLDEATFAHTLRKLPTRPLLAGEDGIRLSLAGAQTKLAIFRSPTGEISVPLGGAPSTHIVKPAFKDYETIVRNEAFCMRLAKAVKLDVANVETGRADGLEYLLVERYDRKTEATNVVRLHQEDFCQAMGYVLKYQNEGGPSLQKCFDLVRNVSSRPVVDLRALLDAVLFNVLIGNNDAHGKNFSLIYDRGVRLAPLYDLICTVAYPDLSRKMAMKIGSRYEFETVLPRHFEAMAEEAKLSKTIVLSRLKQMAQMVIANLDSVSPTAPEIASIIHARCDRILHILTLSPDAKT